MAPPKPSPIVRPPQVDLDPGKQRENEIVSFTGHHFPQEKEKAPAKKPETAKTKPVTPRKSK
ncbi:hypothetical protein Slin15195_G058910 [Septoria linicola]|uniref:Uncharacterized protein n=1 Tax=Septoria linicola TaxID=215465 RepID=A0A9Q9AV62_9PEZI|nr:hypothetical protein Slin14017_G074770 [Septoria linicola]USW52572.1 hypothetical protein Slin15195_G058910 [Septoria linicola]